MRYSKYISALVIAILLSSNTAFAVAAPRNNTIHSHSSDKNSTEPTGTSVQSLETPCHLHVDNPHISTHETPNINVIAWVQCVNIVAEVSMAITIRRDGVEIGTAYFTDRNRSYFEHYMPTYCVSGTYQGRLFATVTPASPVNRSSGYAFSNQIYIQCP